MPAPPSALPPAPPAQASRATRRRPRRRRRQGIAPRSAAPASRAATAAPTRRRAQCAIRRWRGAASVPPRRTVAATPDRSPRASRSPAPPPRAPDRHRPCGDRAHTSARSRAAAPVPRPVASTVRTESRPPGRPSGPRRGSQRAATITTAPAVGAAIRGHATSTVPLHRRSRGTARPIPTPGSINRSVYRPTPSGRVAGHASAARRAATAPAATPNAAATIAARYHSSCSSRLAASRATATRAGSGKRARPVTRPAPYPASSSTAPGGFIPPGASRPRSPGAAPRAICRSASSTCTSMTVRCWGKIERRFGDRLPFVGHHVARRQPVQRIDDHVIPVLRGVLVFLHRALAGDRTRRRRAVP